MAFAMNEVLQVNDMNMYNTLENSFKIPFLLNAFFGVPDGILFTYLFIFEILISFIVFVSPSSVIPPFRIVGFPEHCYTRNLSMVGTLMASAEFCFVTITQRVLAALRVRAQYPILLTSMIYLFYSLIVKSYGHPDFVDGRFK